jgi:hypothetical protein
MRMWVTGIVVSLIALSSISCGGSDSDSTGALDRSEGVLTTTLSIDYCHMLKQGQDGLQRVCDPPLKGLSSDIEVTFPFVTRAGNGFIHTCYRELPCLEINTGPATWTFSNPIFEEHLADLINGRPLRLRVRHDRLLHLESMFLIVNVDGDKTLNLYFEGHSDHVDGKKLLVDGSSAQVDTRWHIDFNFPDGSFSRFGGNGRVLLDNIQLE